MTRSALRHLPAGAIALAEEADKPGSAVILTGAGTWARWWPGTRSIESLPPNTGAWVVAGIVRDHLGGTSAAAAKLLGVSPRTVEHWRCGRPLPHKHAARIAEILAEKS